MKCAASPGGTVFILLEGLDLSTTAGAAAADSISTQNAILRENHWNM
jgi:hypothetical protein